MVERQVKAESAPRKRALVSCDRCKLRRARCIRENPGESCADCKMSGVQCESKLPRKQRVYGSVETLSLRYRALDSLVKGLFPQENTQDVNTLFKLAAARNIPMPPSDDFTPADIFNNDQQPSPEQHQQHHQYLSTPQSLQQTYASSQTHIEPAQSVETISPASTGKESRFNPFSEVQQQPRHIEELIPTRNGVPHYFGPSSSFRLATTIRSLVARYKVASGGDFPNLQTAKAFPTAMYGSSDSVPAGGTGGISLQHPSTQPSDEEYIVPESREAPSQDRRGLKRSRTQLEGSENHWERHPEVSNLYTIGDLLPSRSLADALVSAYFDHVHIYLPLFHRSMFQFRLEATYSRKTEVLEECTDMGWLVCLALVFSFGCQQLHEHDPGQAERLRQKYLGFVKTNFRQLLITTSLANVQALVLLNNHHHTAGQKSCSWLIIGLAARMAMTMGMHRDRANMEFDPIERNTRRTVWFSIYMFEKILCNIIGRPTCIDDREVCMKLPDAPLLEQKSMSADFMFHGCELMKMSYSMRLRAYFDENTAEERTPTLAIAEAQLRECDEFFAKIPPEFSLDFSPVPPEQRARILLLHIYLYHTRSVVSRDFLVHKVEMRIRALESKNPPDTQNWERILALSEDCVESAHRAIHCIMAGAHLGMIGYSWLDLFYVFHAILIVCADFLARPKDQYDSPKDIQRKEMVRAMLNHVRGMKKLAPTYKILGQIAMQFASITGVAQEPTMLQKSSGRSDESSLEPQLMMGEGTAQTLAEITVSHEDWFMHAPTDLGLDFFDVQSTPVIPDPAAYHGYFMDPTTNEVDDWTARTIRGMR